MHTAYRSVLGQLNWLQGRTAEPKYTFVISFLAVHHVPLNRLSVTVENLTR